MDTRRRWVRTWWRTLAVVGAVGLITAACGVEEADPDEVAVDDTPAAEEPADRVVTLVSFGGAYNDAIQSAYLDRFTEETGIEVRLEANTELAPVRLQVETGNVEWDVVDLPASQYEIAIADDLLEPLDYDVIDVSNTPEDVVREHGVMYGFFPFVMAWDETVIDDPPSTWEEFLDPDRYPFRRSVYERIEDGSILEAALIADGVAPEDLYPLDVDRALDYLDNTLGRENIIWHSTNAEPIQQLISGEVPLATAFSGRVVAAREFEEAPLNFTLNQSIMTADYWVVPKGAPNREEAMELINFLLSDADANAAFSELMRYPTSNVESFEVMDQDIREQVPRVGDPGVVLKDFAWWNENLDRVTEQFLTWLVAD